MPLPYTLPFKPGCCPNVAAAGTLTALVKPKLAATLHGAGVLTATATKVSTGPTYDSVGVGEYIAGGTATWNHTIGAGANALIVAGIQFGFGAMSATCNGVTMTDLSSFFTFTSGYYVGIFGMLNPPTGTQTITLTGSAFDTAGSSVAYSGVSIFGTPVQAGGGSSSAAAVSVGSAIGSAAATVMVSAAGGSSTFTGFNQTSRYNQAPASGYAVLLGDAAGATTVNFTATAPSTDFGAIGVSLVGAPATAAAALPGHGALTATAGHPVNAIHGHGALTATAHATQFVLAAALPGHGALSAILDAFAEVLNHLNNNQSSTIQFIGDSTVAGYGDLTNLDAFNQGGYPPRIGMILGAYYNYNVVVKSFGGSGAYGAPVTLYTSSLGGSAPTITIMNGGVDGTGIYYNVLTATGSPGNMLTNGLLPIADVDVVIIGFGINDTGIDGRTTTQYASDYATLISDIQTTYCPGVPIVATTQDVPGGATLNSYTTTFDALTSELVGQNIPLNPPLIQSSTTLGVTVLDTEQAFYNVADWPITSDYYNAVIAPMMYDSLHPNIAGYQVQAVWMLSQLAPNVVNTMFVNTQTSSNLAAHGVLSATATTRNRSAALAGHGVLTGTTTEKSSATAALPGHGVLSAAAHATQFKLAAALSGQGALTATAALKLASSAALSGHGALTAVAHATQFKLAAALSGHGALTGLAEAEFTRLPSLAGSGVLSATARLYSIHTPAALPGHGALTATTIPKFASSTPLQSHGVLSAVANATQFKLAAALPGHGLLTATAVPKFAVTAAVPGHGVLSGVAHATQFKLTAALPGHGALTVTGTAKFTSAAALPGHGVLSATAHATQFTLTAALPGHGALTATTQTGFNRAAALPSHGVLSASAHATQFTLTAALPGHGILTATTALKIAVTAALPGHGVLTATTKATQFKLAAALPAHGVLSATTAPRFVTAVALPGHGVLSATAKATEFKLAAALPSHGTLTGLAEAEFTCLPSLAGHGALTATTTPKIAIHAALPGHGILTATAAQKSARPAALSGHGVLSALIEVGDQRAATLRGHGVLSATAVALDVFITSGQLKIVCTNSYYNLQSEDPFDLTGSSVLVECNQVPNASDNSTHALFYLSETSTLGSGYAVCMGYSGGNFVCGDNNGAGTNFTANTYYNVPFQPLPSIHSWWRMREFAGTVFWDYSPDSLSWTNAASRSISGVTSVYVGFSTGSTAPTPGNTIWNNFNIDSVPAALSSYGILTATASRAARPVVLSAHGALTTTVNLRPTLSGHGVLSATTTAKRPVTATLPGHGALTATATKFTSAGQLSSHGTLTATATARPPAAPTLPGHGALSATTHATQFVLTAALPGHGILTATASRAARPVVLSAHGALTTTVAGNLRPTPSGHGVLSATAHTTQFTLSAALPGHGILAAAVDQILPAAATLHSHGTLSATATKFLRTAALAGHGALSATTAGPKIGTVFDSFGTQNDTQWTGWSVPGLQPLGPDMLVGLSFITIGVDLLAAQLPQTSPSLPGSGTLTAVTKTAPPPVKVTAPPMVVVAVKGRRRNTFVVPRGPSRVAT